MAWRDIFLFAALSRTGEKLGFSVFRSNEAEKGERARIYIHHTDGYVTSTVAASKSEKIHVSNKKISPVTWAAAEPRSSRFSLVRSLRFSKIPTRENDDVISFSRQIYRSFRPFTLRPAGVPARYGVVLAVIVRMSFHHAR